MNFKRMDFKRWAMLSNTMDFNCLLYISTNEHGMNSRMYCNIYKYPSRAKNYVISQDLVKVVVIL